jgi:Reverse transcriptase (RNA-dependent DNA polymerase)/Endonuclease-reverse transcriptase
VRNDLCRSDEIMECLIIEISQQVKKRTLNFTVGCIYRPPNGNMIQFNTEFTKLLSSIEGRRKKNKNKTSLLAGDLNIDLIRSQPNKQTDEFENILLSHSYVPTITRPTRVTNATATLIDNIFINNLYHPVKSAVVYNDISDHFPIVLHIDIPLAYNVKSEVNKSRVYTSNSIKCFTCELGKVDWDLLLKEHYSIGDVDNLYKVFLDKYSSMYKSHFPYESKKHSSRQLPRHEWITPGLIKSCNTKSRLYKKYRTNPTIMNENIYKKYRNKLKDILIKTEKNFYSDKLMSCSGNTKQIWKILGTLTTSNSRDKIAFNFEENGKSITDPNLIVDKFNAFFANIGVDLASKIPTAPADFSSYLKGTFVNSFILLPTDALEIISVANLLQNKKSSGVDEITVEIMKKTIHCIAEPLANIVNSSFKSGKFPELLKIAKICPIYKEGSRKEFQNYRPISVLPSFSKIYERLVYNRLCDYTQKLCILSPKQYGFRAGYSTYMSLLDFYDKVSNSIENKCYTVGIFIDLKKAFDTIDHHILLKKLFHYGIRGVALDWFESYLSSRQQYVSIGNIASTLRPNNCGVPQGSILGPLLFILYINDIVNCSQLLYFTLFADDTNLLFSNKDFDCLIRILNVELEKLSNWFKANKLSLNAKKTNFMIFGHKIPSDQLNINIVLDGIRLGQVCATKFLGVHIDQKLNWNLHVSHLSKKISKNLGIMWKVSYKLNSDTLKMLYHALILPHLNYCLIVWGGTSKKNLDILLKLQKKAVRIITKSRYRDHSEPLFHKLKLLRISDLYKLQIANFVFKKQTKSMENNIIKTLQFEFEFKIVVRSRESRNTLHRLITPAYRTETRRKSIACTGPRVWNSLPIDITGSVFVSEFKRRLHSYFIDQYRRNENC